MFSLHAKKKILFFTGSLDSGGAEKITAFLCNNISVESFEKVLVLGNNVNQNYEINALIKIIDLDLKKISGGLWKIIRVIRAEKPDYVFTTLTAMNLMVCLSRFFVSSNIKFIVRESTILSTTISQFSKPALIKFLITFLYKRADAIVAQSVAMKEDMVQHFNLPANKIIQIYNPVSPKAVPQSPRLFPNHFISVGNIRLEKGYDRIIAALALLKFDFKYVIVGDGPDMSKIVALVKDYGLEDKVHFVGRQKNPNEFLAKAGLFLQGSYYEGFPNAVLEAGACGLPVVAFDCPGGTKEIIENGKNGFLVTGNSIDAYASQIEAAIKHTFDSELIRQYTLAKFDEQKILKQYEAIFT